MPNERVDHQHTKGNVVGSRSGKKGRAQITPQQKIAAAIGVPALQIANDRFEACDVVNHTEADHRAMVRALGAQMLNPDARRTIRRKPTLTRLYDRGLIDQQELRACEWYKTMHAARYDTLGITANYGGAGGTNGKCSFDHGAKTAAQREALLHFDYARAGINRFLLGMFERVVLYSSPVGNLRLQRSFRLAIKQLIERVAGRAQL